MEEKQKTYINAIVLETGERIMVVQDGKGSPFFTDVTGRKHHIETLDLSEALSLPLFDQSEQMRSLTDIIKTFDVKAQDEHRAMIAEREYWRKLRGDIFIELFRNPLYFDRGIEGLLNDTKYLVNQLWQQDQDFSIRKISKNEAT